VQCFLACQDSTYSLAPLAHPRNGSSPHLFSELIYIAVFAGRRRYLMISREKVATESSAGRGTTADRAHHPQDPMALQNNYGLGANDFQPQKLIRLVGCRLPQSAATKIAWPSDAKMQHHGNSNEGSDRDSHCPERKIGDLHAVA
jgi:hypothetical protein